MSLPVPFVRSSASRRVLIQACLPPFLERLETRSLFSVSSVTPITNTFGNPGGAATTVDLSGAFDESTVTGTVVRFSTSLGNIDIELFDTDAPKTTQNFVNYVANHLYDNTVIHSSQPGFILQGGAYDQSGTHISQGPPVKNEFSASHPNDRGTIAMVALPATDTNGNPVPGGGPNSATSEFLFNLADNADLNTTNGGYTVFGQVINNTMETVDSIAALPVDDASALSPVFSQLPVRNLPSGNPDSNDFVFINTATVIPETDLLTLTATSDNPSVVNPTIDNDALTLNYGSTSGSARITVTATDVDGSSASQTFTAGNGELTVPIGSGGVGSAINFVEADGGKGSVALSKGGAGFVRFTGTGLAIAPGKKLGLSGTITGIAGISTIDTGTGSTLTIKTKGGDGAVDVGGITTDGPLKALSMTSTRLTGTSTIGGTVRSAAFGAITSADVTFGGSPADGIQLAFSAATVTDSNITSGMPVKSVKAAAFISSTTTPGIFTAPTVASVSTKGAFEESLATTGAIKSIKAGGNQEGDIAATVLGSLSAAGLEGGIFTLSAPYVARGLAVGKISVKGTLANTTIRALGNIGSISAAIVTAGRIYAGANVPDEEFPPFLPTDLAQFTANARIASVKVTTSADQLSIAASSLGNLSLGKVATDGPIPFGVAATVIDSLSGSTADTDLGPGVPFNFKKLDDQTAFDAKVSAAGIPLGNFEVTLF